MIDLKFDAADDFSEGFAFAKLGDLWGIIDLAGDWVVEPRFTHVGERGFGVGVVQIGEAYHVIEMRGRLLLGPYDSRPHLIDEGLVAARVNGGDLFEVVTLDGHRVIEPHWNWIMPFSDGLAFVRSPENSGYIDYSGELVISFDSADVSGLPFTNGLAQVWFLKIGSQRGFEGYINREGDWVHRRDLR